MTEPFKIWIEDKETFKKVVKQMDKDGIKWVLSRDCASFRIDLHKVPIALFVNSDNELSWSNNKEWFKNHEYSEITPEEYLKKNKTMIKAGDIVRVTDWGCQFSFNSVWFIAHIDDLETEWLIKYAHGDSTHYDGHQYTDTNKYRVLYVDEHDGKCLITQKSYSDRVYDVYLIGLKGVELYDKPTEMTISEIEEKLGIKNLKIVKEDEDGSHHYQCKEFKSVARRNIECSHKQYLDIPSDFVHNSNIAFWILDDITMEEKYGKDGRSPEYECLMRELEQNRNEENESMKGRPEWLKKLWQ